VVYGIFYTSHFYFAFYLTYFLSFYYYYYIFQNIILLLAFSTDFIHDYYVLIGMAAIAIISMIPIVVDYVFFVVEVTLIKPKCARPLFCFLSKPVDEHPYTTVPLEYHGDPAFDNLSASEGNGAIDTFSKKGGQGFSFVLFLLFFAGKPPPPICFQKRKE
jgi:hypothetical protein